MMSSSEIFTLASAVMFIPWALMIGAPKWRWTEPIAFLAALLFMVAAVGLIWKSIALAVQDEGSLRSINGLARLFQSQEMVWAGWLNYLAFSICASIWQLNDSREIKLAHLLVVPSLVLTFLAGPMGLLAYLIIRWAKTKKWQVR